MLARTCEVLRTRDRLATWTAALVIGRLGDPAAAPAMVAALGREADRIAERPETEDPFEQPRDRLLGALLQAAGALARAGAAELEEPRDAGEALFWLRALATVRDRTGDPGWKETWKALAVHPHPRVRETAVRSLRDRGTLLDDPMPADLLAWLRSLGRDPDPGVRRSRAR